MTRKKLISIILAGGRGTRLKYKTPKVLLKIKNKKILHTSINLAKYFTDDINIVINQSLIFLKKKNKKV